MTKRTDRWIEVVLAIMLVIIVGANVGWMRYRYGGEHYYMRITGDRGSFPVSEPVGVTVNGHTYHNRAVNAAGKAKVLTVKTVSADPGPFHKGDILRVTVNQHYGVTNYKRVAVKHVPTGLQLP